MRDLFCQTLDIVFFDTTSLVYFGEEDPEVKKTREAKKNKKSNKEVSTETQGAPPLLARGFSKDHRSDLPQIVVGVLMSKEGIPLAHEVFPGNTNDLSCFKEIITQLSRKYPIGKILLVGDRGMICQKNLDFLHEKKLEYILGYRMRTIPKRDRALVLSKADLLKVRDDLSFKEVIYNNQRLLVCYNPEHAILDAQKKEDILDRIRKRIKGRSINTKLSSGTIIETYKGLWQVEHAFRNLKTELEMGPVYHWK